MGLGGCDCGASMICSNFFCAKLLLVNDVAYIVKYSVISLYLTLFDFAINCHTGNRISVPLLHACVDALASDRPLPSDQSLSGSSTYVVRS